MNLTLSLAINGGTGTGTTKKRKLRDSDDGGDHSSRVMMRLVQSSREQRTRMANKVVEEAAADDDPPSVVAAATDDDVDVAGGSGLQLMHLLLASVSAAESGDARAAAAALHEVRRRASFRGADPAHRVAAHFADALSSSSSRIVGRSSPPPMTTTTTRAERFLAYTMFYQASPIYQMAHFTANQAIMEAFDENTIAGGRRRRRRRLHVVDFDVSYGFQWPSLIQSLSDAATAAASTSTSTSTNTSTSTTTSSSSHDDDERSPAVSLRITGFGRSADELRRTEARLARFARGCCPNLRFEFEGIVHDNDDDSSGGGHRHDERMIKVDEDATVVVNLVFPAPEAGAQRSSATLLARIRELNPSLVFLVEKHGGGNAALRGGRRPAASLVPEFTARLRYFAAVFDSLHECLPADSAERLAIERNHLGVEISDAMASLFEGGDDHSSGMMMAEPNKPSSSGSSWNWKERMEGAGFEGVELSSRTVSQAKLLLKMKSGGSGGGGGFRVVVEGGEGGGGRAMSLGWRDCAQLITATAWRRRSRRRSRSIN